MKRTKFDMATYLRTVGGYGPDDIVLVNVEVFDILKCCDERLLSGADMLEREMGMGRGLFEKGNLSMGTVAGNLALSCVYISIQGLLCFT